MYPKEVEEVSEIIFECYEEDLLSDFKNRTKDWIKPIAISVINEYMLPKFLGGEDLVLTVKDALQLIVDLKVKVSIASLKERGLVDTIEDEKGETVIFLTKEGKDISKHLKKDKHL